MGRTCEEILGRIPPPFHVDAALAKYPTRREQSLNTVLVQEMSRYNTLITTITTTLHAVLRAIEGESSDLFETGSDYVKDILLCFECSVWYSICGQWLFPKVNK